MVRSETLPALIDVTSRQVPCAVTVVGAHQSVLERGDASPGAADAALVLGKVASEDDVLSDASAASERVEEQRLADPRS